MTMIEPKFQVGDRVLCRLDGKIYSIADRQHNKASATHIIEVQDGAVMMNPTTLAEHWTYKLEGRRWACVENLLEYVPSVHP